MYMAPRLWLPNSGDHGLSQKKNKQTAVAMGEAGGGAIMCPRRWQFHKLSPEADDFIGPAHLIIWLLRYYLNRREIVYLHVEKKTKDRSI